VLDALYPLAAQIRVYGDKESIVFEGPSTATTWQVRRPAGRQVLAPRFADDDFTRNRQDALDYVTKTLRGNADEDLGKQAMATVMLRGHPTARRRRGRSRA
jgi:zinc protease